MRLVKMASEQSRGDRYTGKRRKRRFKSPSLQLEAAFDPWDPSEVFSVTSHNIGLTGTAFWARREIEPGTNVYLREFTVEGTSRWVGAHVTHCAFGIRGYLVGAEFHHPVTAAGAEANNNQPEGERPRPAGCGLSASFAGSEHDASDLGHDNAKEEGDEKSSSKRRGLLGWLGLSE